MNKKKSKALAFLLAASLLVPSANGIISAAELRGNDVVAQEHVEGATGSDATTGGETTESKIITVTDTNQLKSTIEGAKEGSIIKIAANINNGQPIEVNDVITINNKIEICVENKVSINGENLTGVTLKGDKIFAINADGVVIRNLILENKTKDETDTDSTKKSLIGIGGNLNTNGTTIEGCYFRGEPIWNLITAPKTSKIIFKDNNVKMKARAMIVGVSNGSIISGNTINLLGEKYEEGKNNRTGVLSLIAAREGDGVTIENNTFENANRAIGVDNATISGDALKIKDNKFINTRFAFETDSRTEKKSEDDKELNNIGNTYDLSGNYYKYGEEVGPLRIEDASSKGSHFEENGTSTELIIDDKTPLNIAVGPYYTTEDESGNLGGVVNNGVATVNGKDYQTLAKAIEAAQSGQTVTIHKDVELTKANGILVDKNITITSTNNAKLILNEQFTLGVKGTGHLTLSDMTIELKKPEVNYLRNKGATLEILECKIAPYSSMKDFQTASNLIADNRSGASYEERAKSKIILKHNEITLHARGLVSCVGNGSEIIDNKFDLCKEEFTYTNGEKNRTGVLSIIADDIEGEDKKVIIEGNTFKNANRAIGVDHSKIKGKNLIIKKNKFIDTRYAFEVDVRNSQENKNLNKKYDISGNYFEFAGKVSEPKIQDANADSKDRISDKSEVKAEDAKAAGVGLDDWPYYTNESCTHLSNESYGPSKPSYTHKEIIGSDRYDTAARIADQLGSYDTVVLVNATSTMSDGLSASGLAGKENGAILLVKKDSIPKVTMDRIKKVKKVYIIGGENAISAKVANEITAANIKVERLGGKTRVETSEIVAEKLGNYKDAFVVNGFKGEADAMSASAVAAKNKAPILLTNGKESSHDKKSGVKYYVIGGNNVVDKSIADKYSAEVLAGKDRYATNREVIDEFYSGSDKLYLANGDKLVDALTASPLAKKDGIVLVNEKSDKSILKGKNTVQVGGMDFEIKFEK